MATRQENHALLLFRVGPVLCCVPSAPVEALIEPRPATRMPTGTTQTAVFRHAGHIVSALDLRERFGVDPAEQADPGRVIVTRLDAGRIGFHVDDIMEVIDMPASGWGALPPLLPRGVFTRTLLRQEKIWLYAEFDKLQGIAERGYLRQYIQHLQQTAVAPAGDTAPVSEHVTPPETTRKESPVRPREREAATVSEHATAKVSAATRTPRASTVPSQSKPAVPDRSRQTPAAPALGSRDLHTHKRDTPAQAVSPHLPAATSDPVARKTAPPAHGKASTPPGLPDSPVRKPHNTATQMRKQADARSLRHKPSHDTDMNPLGGIAILIALLLLLGGVGLGTWYLVSPNETTRAKLSASPRLTTASNTSHVDTDPVIPNQSAPLEETPVTADTPELEASMPEAVATTDPEPIAAAVPDDTTGAANDEPALQAMIERDAQGITITVEVPEDDPVFRASANTGTDAPAETTSLTSGEHSPDRAEQSDTPNSESAVVNTEQDDTPAGVATAPVTGIDSVEIIHTVVKGDTLWHIAKRYVDNPYRYPELARLSNIRNPDLIYPGDRVRILKRKRKKPYESARQ